MRCFIGLWLAVVLRSSGFIFRGSLFRQRKLSSLHVGNILVNNYMSLEPTYIEKGVAQNADMMFVIGPGDIINEDQTYQLGNLLTGEPRYFRVDKEVLVQAIDGTKFSSAANDLSDTNLVYFFESPVQNVTENFAAIKHWVSTHLFRNEQLNVLVCKPSHVIRFFANNGKWRR